MKNKPKYPRMTAERKIEEWLAIPAFGRSCDILNDKNGTVILTKLSPAGEDVVCKTSLRQIIAKRYPRKKRNERRGNNRV